MGDYNKKIYIGWLSVALLLFLIFVPISIWLSIFYQSLASSHFYIPPTGWWPSWLQTIAYGALSTFFQLTVGILLAVLIYFCEFRKTYKKVMLVTVLLLPYAIPPSITIMMFDFGFSSNGYITKLLGIFPEFESPLHSSSLGLFLVMCLVSVWQYAPFFFVATLLSFYSVPINILKQARSDGLNNFSILTRILLPMAVPAILSALALRLILMLGKVDIALSYDEKSALSGAKTIPVQIVVNMFSFNSVTPAGLILLMALILAVPTVAYWVLQGRQNAK